MTCEGIGHKIYEGINSLETASDRLANFSRTIREGESSRGHYIWVVPTSIALNLTKIVLAPLIALTNLLAAAIFGLMSLCVESLDEELAKAFLLLSVRNVTDGLYTSFDRLFFPSTEATGCVSVPFGKCLGLQGIEG